MKVIFRRFKTLITYWMPCYFYKFISVFIVKDKSSILFLPHPNTQFDGYDILNPLSDNTLCLFNDMMSDCRFDGYQLILGVYNTSKISQYQQFCAGRSRARISFVDLNNVNGFLKRFIKCKFVFTSETLINHPYKNSRQIVICLNYFSSFMKDDFIKLEMAGGYKAMLKEQKRMYRTYDYHMSISDVCSKFIALDNCMYYPRMKPLGFPRNDVFFQDNSSLRHKIESTINVPFDKIFCYVPTHRDYENTTSALYDRSIGNHSIFGPCSDEELRALDTVLEKTNSIVIAKVHPKAASSLIIQHQYKRVFLFSELKKAIDMSLNPLLAISDFLITDYTTTVFDFLYTGRPIVYYFYDYQKYNDSRGLFINPIDPMCMGQITYNLYELIDAIDSMNAGSDPYRHKRECLSDLLIKYKDGHSTERIKEFFLKDVVQN